MTTRRDVLRTMGVGAAALAASTSGSSALAAAVAPSVEAFATGEAASSPWWILHPLREGSRLGKGWKVGGLSEVRDGAAVLTLTNSDGRQVDLHICARSRQAVGVAQSVLFDLVTMDGRAGTDATPEDMGRVVLSLAQRIRQNELTYAGDLKPFAHLMSHKDRVALYGPARLLLGHSVG